MIKELHKANPKAGIAELYGLAKKYPVMKEILARGRVKLKSKETIRNVLNPRGCANKDKKAKEDQEYDASGAESRETIFNVYLPQ